VEILTLTPIEVALGGNSRTNFSEDRAGKPVAKKDPPAKKASVAKSDNQL
jgi:hypothetical protein